MDSNLAMRAGQSIGCLAMPHRTSTGGTKQIRGRLRHKPSSQTGEHITAASSRQNRSSKKTMINQLSVTDASKRTFEHSDRPRLFAKRPEIHPA